MAGKGAKDNRTPDFAARRKFYERMDAKKQWKARTKKHKDKPNTDKESK